METTSKPSKDKPVKGRSNTKRLWKRLLLAAALLAVGVFSYVGYIYAASPEVIREPLLEHYHFRMQIIVNGKSEDFSSKAYQKEYDKGQCNSLLTKEPIHFHDGVSQITHIHWEGMTGGLVMKNYGWDYIGGINGALGYRFDDPLKPSKVQIHGDILPIISGKSQLYVYSGDKDSYKLRNFDEWKSQDLEKFFGTTSNFPAHKLNQEKRGLLDTLFPKTYAHDDAVHEQQAVASEEERTRVNNLIGNVVIFAQQTKPSDKQVRDRFNELQPLSDSTCGG